MEFETIRERNAWYIKWFSSICLLIGMSCRASGVPELAFFDLVFSTVGVFGWLIVAVIWIDRALIILNAVGLSILISGLLKSLIGG